MAGGSSQGKEVGAVAGWQAYHFFYQGSLDRLLGELVYPLVQSLWQAGKIESFFFVRYRLGGPHIRLRVLARDAEDPSIEPEIFGQSARHFAAFPSPAVLTESMIRRENEQILRTDGDGEDCVFPNNSVQAFPFVPETARYGGAGLLGSSLDFFALSSLWALDTTLKHLDKGRSLAHFFRLLALQALGFAEAPAGLLALLETPRPGTPEEPHPILAKAEAEWARRQASLGGLLREAAASFTEAYEARASRLFSRRLEAIPDQDRSRILSSQMHMTANRLGLTNLEEIYLMRILALGFRELASPGKPSALDPAFSPERVAPGPRSPTPLRALLAAGLNERTRPAGPPREESR